MQNYSTTELLKISTKTLHSKTEQALNARFVFNADFSEKQYTHLLYKLYFAYAEIEHNIINHSESESINYFISNYFESKAPLIQSDLQVHSIHTHKPEILSFITNPHKALGAMYVMKGSDAGGRLILNEIQNKAKNWPLFSANFYQAAAKSYDSWNNFKADINQADFTNNQKADMVEGASIAFKRIITIANNDKILP